MDTLVTPTQELVYGPKCPAAIVGMRLRRATERPAPHAERQQSKRRVQRYCCFTWAAGTGTCVRKDLSACGTHALRIQRGHGAPHRAAV